MINEDCLGKCFRWGWGRSDPFLTILRSGEFGQWRVVHRTEVGIMNKDKDKSKKTITMKEQRQTRKRQRQQRVEYGTQVNHLRWSWWLFQTKVERTKKRIVKAVQCHSDCRSDQSPITYFVIVCCVGWIIVIGSWWWTNGVILWLVLTKRNWVSRSRGGWREGEVLFWFSWLILLIWQTGKWDFRSKSSVQNTTETKTFADILIYILSSI